MKIGLSGVAGTGKTTILKELEKRIGEVVDIPEVVRTLVKKNNMAINEKGTLETELSVLTAHIQNLLTIPNFISDRCLIDNTIYTKLSYLFPGKEKYVNFNDFLIDKLVDHYDIIFYIPVEFHPPEDGVRNLKIDFYQSSIRLFEGTYSQLLKRFKNIVILKGNREERVNIIFTEIEKKLRS